MPIPRMAAPRYRLLHDRVVNEKVFARAGDTVYRLMRPDYGLAADDEHATGVVHVSVTLSPDGDYPFFTVPSVSLGRP